MIENDVSLLSFNQETSLINYKKVQLMIKDIQILSNQQKKNSKNEIKLKLSFFYDKHTNQFIYINGEVIIILDTKCKMKAFSRIKLEEEVKTVSVEYNNKYILLTTIDYKLHIINLLDLEEVDCNIYKKDEYIGGFFIPYKNPEKKHDYFIVCLMSKNTFNIKRITKIKGFFDNSFKYKNKSNYISNKMKILDYEFNPVFKILLIIKSNPISFVLFNLKSKSCYRISIIINIINIKENEYKLYMQQIYQKLYLIYLDNSNYINIYRINNLKKIKEPRKIKYNKTKEKFEVKNIKLQFYNNLIILYMQNFIRIYDIKSTSINFEVAMININEKDYNIFINSNILGKYLLIDNDYYKIKFLKTNFKNDSYSTAKEIFFTLLRRKNSNQVIKEILFEYLNNYKIWNFFDVIEEIIIRHKKYNQKKSEIYNEDKNNAYAVTYLGNNQFFLTEDYLITLFNQCFNEKIKPEMLIKTLCYMHFLYEKHDFQWNINLFYASLFGQINKIDDIQLLEYIVRNKIIPINEKIGVYFIMRAKCFKDLENNKKCSNLGIDILMNECKNEEINIDVILDNININDFKESFEMILNI